MLSTVSPVHSVVAKPILNDNNIKQMEALNLSTIENTEEKSSRTSQDLGAPIELSVVKSQKRYSDIFESENSFFNRLYWGEKNVLITHETHRSRQIN